MSSSILLMFPECLSRSILNDWLPLTNVGHLDSAHCSNKARHQFLKLLSVYQVLGDRFKVSSWNEYPILVWSIKRAVRVGGFTVSSKLLADNMLQETLFALSGPLIRWITFEEIDCDEQLMSAMASAIKYCSNTQALHLNIRVLPTALCDECFPQLTQAFPRLHTLHIQDSQLSTEGIKVMLQHCITLKLLHMSYMTNPLPVEVALPSLEQFSVRDSNILEAVLFAIAANCPRMKHMDIFKNSSIVSDEAMQAILQGCPLLQYTDVECATSLSHELRVELARRRNFTELRFGSTFWNGITSELCENILRVSPNLLKLFVYSRSWLMDDVLAVCAQHCKSLEYLYLDHCQLISATGIHAVTTPGNALNKVELWGCTGLGDEAVLAVAQRCSHLKMFMSPKHVSSEAIVALAKGCPLLEEVYVGHTNADDAALVALCLHCPLLRTLVMCGCKDVTLQAKAAMKAQYPKLHIRL